MCGWDVTSRPGKTVGYVKCPSEQLHGAVLSSVPGTSSGSSSLITILGNGEVQYNTGKGQVPALMLRFWKDGSYNEAPDVTCGREITDRESSEEKKNSEGMVELD